MGVMERWIWDGIWRPDGVERSVGDWSSCYSYIHQHPSRDQYADHYADANSRVSYRNTYATHPVVSKRISAGIITRKLAGAVLYGVQPNLMAGIVGGRY